MEKGLNHESTPFQPQLVTASPPANTPKIKSIGRNIVAPALLLIPGCSAYDFGDIKTFDSATICGEYEEIYPDDSCDNGEDNSPWFIAGAPRSDRTCFEGDLSASDGSTVAGNLSMFNSSITGNFALGCNLTWGSYSCGGIVDFTSTAFCDDGSFITHLSNPSHRFDGDDLLFIGLERGPESDECYSYCGVSSEDDEFEVPEARIFDVEIFKGDDLWDEGLSLSELATSLNDEGFKLGDGDFHRATLR